MQPDSTAYQHGAEPMPVLRSNPLVLACLLDGLGGAVSTPREAVSWLLCDPALTARLLDDQAEAAGPAASLLESADCGHLKSRLLATVADTLRRLPEPDPAGRWDSALACAHLCRTLARRLGYPDPEEAYLAGLLHNLDLFAADAAPCGDADFRRIGGWLAHWRHGPQLAAAILAQTEDALRLAESLPLARLLRVACASADGDTNAGWLGETLLPDLAPGDLDRAREEALDSVSALKRALAEAAAPAPEPERLISALQSHLLLERLGIELAGARTEAQALDAVAGALEELFQVRQPLYLVHDATNDLLRLHTEYAAKLPGLSIRLPDSNSAAAWAWNSRQPVFFSTRDADSVSLLDNQLAQLAGLDAVIAIPVGETVAEGVLFGCVAGRRIPDLERYTAGLIRIGRLAGRTLLQIRSRPADAAANHEDKVRRAAHEINNPLGIAKNYLAILGKRLADENQVAGELEIVREELDRIPRIVYGLTENEKAAGMPAERCDVTTLVRDMAVVAESAIPLGKHIRVTTRIARELPILRSDPSRLRQLLLNLILNALEASPDGGEIGIEAYTSVDQRGDSRIIMTVKDNGPGIAAERLPHMFEPLPSGKDGQHAGLGLAIVKTLADELNMTVACRSDEHGTIFQITPQAA